MIATDWYVTATNCKHGKAVIRIICTSYMFSSHAYCIYDAALPVSKVCQYLRRVRPINSPFHPHTSYGAPHLLQDISNTSCTQAFHEMLVSFQSKYVTVNRSNLDHIKAQEVETATNEMSQVARSVLNIPLHARLIILKSRI